MSTTPTALQDLGLALETVAGKGSKERELLLAVSRCLCTSLNAAQHATDADASSLALRLVNALDGLLARCRDRSLTTEVRLHTRTPAHTQSTRRRLAHALD